MKFPREKFEQLSKGKPLPHYFKIAKRNQVLFYFGANHSHDPKNKQYPALKKYWQRFLIGSSSRKLVVVEGGLRRLERTAELAVRHGSEGSFITILAHQKHISIISPEPTEKQVITALRKKFREDYIQYYKFACLIDSWHRQHPRPEFESWLNGVIRWYAKQLGFKQFTLERMQTVHEEILKKPFNYKDQRFFNSICNPNNTKTVINKVAQYSSDIRDAAVVQRLQKEWKAGKSLFVVYGSGHAFIQEAILKKALK